MAVRKQAKPRTKKRQQKRKGRPAKKGVNVQNHDVQFDDRNVMRIYDLAATRQRKRKVAKRVQVPLPTHITAKNFPIDYFTAPHRQQYMEDISFLHRSPSPVYQVMNNYMARFEKIRLDNMRRQEEEAAAAAAAEAAAAAAAAAAAQAEEDEKNIDLSKIKVNLPHLRKRPVYYYDLSEKERKKLSPRTLVREMFQMRVTPTTVLVHSTTPGLKSGKNGRTKKFGLVINRVNRVIGPEGGNEVMGEVNDGGNAPAAVAIVRDIPPPDNPEEEVTTSRSVVDKKFFKRKSLFTLGPEYKPLKRKANRNRTREAECKPTIEVDEMSQLFAVNFGSDISVSQCLPDSTTN